MRPATRKTGQVAEPLKFNETVTTAAGDGGNIVIKFFVGFADPNCDATPVECTIHVCAEVPCKEKKDK